MEEEMISMLNQEMNKVTTMLEFLIVQPNLLTSMIGNEKEKIMLKNLLRIRCCKLWSENMVNEIESKCSKESIKAINELFKLVEVNKKNRTGLSSQ